MKPKDINIKAKLPAVVEAAELPGGGGGGGGGLAVVPGGEGVEEVDPPTLTANFWFLLQCPAKVQI